jgi:hypothetical protein
LKQLEADKDDEIKKLDEMCNKYNMDRVKRKVMDNLEKNMDEFELNEREIDDKEQ